MWRSVRFTAVLVVNCFVLFSSCSEHLCSYANPEVDNVEYGVKLPEPKHRLRKRQTYHHLRIKPFYDHSVDRLSEAARATLIAHVTAAVQFWQRALLLQSRVSSIFLHKHCSSGSYFNGNNGSFCFGECKKVTFCGEVVIPEQHLKPCHSCSSDRTACLEATPSGSRGVPRADFLLYVSVVNTQRCTLPDNIAYAAHCQLEAHLDRPIAGHMNICPHAMSVDEKDNEVLSSTIKHEILHALGFSASLYAFYRDDAGRPLTPRGFNGLPLTFNPSVGFFQPSDRVVRTVTRPDWWVKSGATKRTMHFLVTHRVQAEVRQHFNCSLLEGAELENQGTNGTIFGHLEKRVFENEAMTGTHTQNPIYSRITLAIMEDTGWYKANYDVAEPLLWGQNLGCDFAMRSCGEWIRNARLNNSSPAPYCTKIKSKNNWKHMKTTCSVNRDSLALCHLIEYQHDLPVEYQNFDYLDDVPDDLLARYGGSVELADYCPYPQEFEWKNAENNQRDSRCGFEANSPTPELNGALEQYGLKSRCFNLVHTWSQQSCTINRTYFHHGAGCYEHFCQDGRLWLSLLNGTAVYPCFKAGQLIRIRRILNQWLHTGTVACPACSELCENCVADIEPPYPVEDEPKRLFCSAKAPLLCLYLFIPVLLRFLFIIF